MVVFALLIFPFLPRLPDSVAGPLCLDILAFVRRNNRESDYKKPEGFAEIAKLAKPGSEKAPLQILGACRDAEVPDAHICTICHLLLTHSWPTQSDESNRDAQTNEVARCLVTVLLQSTIHLDLIGWAVDDIPHADQLSWKVFELLHQYSCNFMVLMASRPVAGTDMNVDLQFWEQLHKEGKRDDVFLFLELKGMTKDEINLMVKRFAFTKEWHSSVDLAATTKDVFVQSGKWEIRRLIALFFFCVLKFLFLQGGVPELAAQILERQSAKITGSGTSDPHSPKGKSKVHVPFLRVFYFQCSMHTLTFTA